VRNALALACSLAVVALTGPNATAATDVSFSDGILTISGDDAADDVVVSCVAGSVDLGGQDAGIACDAVERLEVRGGEGADLIDLSGLATDVFPTLASVKAWGDAGDDTLLGSPLDDRFDGGPGADEIRGGDGKDRLTPQDGGGVVAGGDGKDRIIVSGAGPWTFDRGAIATLATTREETHLQSIETIVYLGTDDADVVSGVNFPGSVIADGGDGDDLLYAGRGPDRLVGGAGDDHLDGGPAHDVLLGKADNDFLAGGDGRDTLIGGPGSDFCLGGPGTDLNRSC
jgi:Ca2+-binding RTX toxin-like protein